MYRNNANYLCAYWNFVERKRLSRIFLNYVGGYNLPSRSTYYLQGLGKPMDMQELQWLYRTA